MENNNLAKISLGINAILLILIIIIFIKLPSTGGDTSSVDSNDSTYNKVISSDFSSDGKIAFFNMDSLNSKLKLYKEIENEIKEINKNAEQKMRKKQGEIDAWKEKWAKKGKLLSSEEEQYFKEGQNIQNDAMQFEQNVYAKLEQETNELLQTYAMRISNATEQLAKDKGYDAIFAYQFGQSLWFYNPNMDVTLDLAKVMNDDFEESTGATAEK